MKLTEYAKAEVELNRALKLKPESAETLYLLGQAAYEQSRPVDALELLVRAHKLAPQNTDVIFLLARVSMTQNYFEDAIPLLESGLKIAPQRPDLRAALGESYFMAGKTESAIEEFKKLIEVDPSARSYAFMGLSYRHLGRFEEALKYFEQGLKTRSARCVVSVQHRVHPGTSGKLFTGGRLVSAGTALESEFLGRIARAWRTCGRRIRSLPRPRNFSADS